MFDVDFLGFPRRTCRVLLPSRPTGATRAGLTLYDNTLFHQRLAFALGTALLKLGLQGVYRIGSLALSVPDQQWWSEWCRQIAAPVTGRVACAAFRFREDRIVAMRMTPSGQPTGFVKVWRESENGLTAVAVASRDGRGEP